MIQEIVLKYIYVYFLGQAKRDNLHMVTTTNKNNESKIKDLSLYEDHN